MEANNGGFYPCSEYGNPEKRKRSFLPAMAKLDDNIMYLCFSQVSFTLTHIMFVVIFFKLKCSMCL